MKRDFILNRIIKVMLLVLSMTVGQNALAESSWTVENSKGASNTFTIKRSEKGYAQKVLYRTVSLSAYAGQHYTAKYGELEFLENEDTKTVTVTESTPNVDSYKYQNGATRQYKLEVTDRAGLLLASATRDMTIGYNVASSGVFDNKSYTIRSSEVTVTEDGYAQSSNPHTVASTQFYTEGTKAYLVYLNAELRMRLEFQAKEVNDGYQYVQILTDNTTGCDTGAGDGNPGTPNVSHYMAGFDIGGKGVDTYYKYSFPVPSVGNDAGATKPWTELSNSVADLKKQKFNTGCRASDGRLILPTGFSTLVVRFNASGSDEDDWKAKDIKAFIQASDATMPTKLSVSAAPGRHAKGNTVYVSVAFSEIVTISGNTKKLTSSWGDLNYVAGSGTNVLTFSGIISNSASGTLSITGLTGTVQDLAGKGFTWSGTDALSTTLDGNLTYTINDFYTDGSGNYLIACHDDLWGLASYVNAGNNASGKTFLQVADISFAHTTNWNNASSTENNFSAIGSSTSIDYRFMGTYDGGGHSISGIRIYKDDTSNSDKYQGLFGYVQNGTVRNVNLADARITGHNHVGGIVGYSYQSTVEDCTVGDNVCIHAVQSDAKYHGGIMGYSNQNTVQRCISHVTLSVANNSNCAYYAGIVGSINSGTLSDCLAIGVVIPNVNNRGIIFGSKSNITPTRNYFLGCTGMDQSSNIFAITLGTNVTLNRTPATDPLPGTNNMTYNDGATIGGTEYYIKEAAIPLNYSGEVSTGYHLVYSATAGTISGSTLIMPAKDVTVTATVPANHYYVEFNKNGGSGEMLIQGFNYDEVQNLRANTYTREDYVFNGWNTQADGNGTSYTNQQEVSNLTATNGGFFTLYAQWRQVAGSCGDNARWSYDDNGTLSITGSGTMSDYDENNFPWQDYKTYITTVSIGDDITEINGLPFKGCTNLAIVTGGSGLTNVYYAAFAFTPWREATKASDTVTYLGHVAYCGQGVSGDVIIDDGTVCIADFAFVNDNAITSVTIPASVTSIGKNAFNNCSALTTVNVLGTTPSMVVNDAFFLLESDKSLARTFNVRSADYKTASGWAHIYNKSGYFAGFTGTEMRVVSTLTLPDNVTDSAAAADKVTILGTDYYVEEADVTISGLGTEHTDGGVTYRSRATVIYNTDQTINLDVDQSTGQATFIMPAADATVTAEEYAYAVKYIDADGTEKTCYNPTVIQSSNSDVILGSRSNSQPAWYVVPAATVTVIGKLWFEDPDVRLILCDGATLTVTCNDNNALQCDNGPLTIYGQSQQSGTLNATSSGNHAIFSQGGAINNITINGGIVNATATRDAIYSNMGNVIINGGIVSATGGDKGIYADKTITLGWTNPTDHIYASSYNKNPIVKDGQTLTDGNAAYSGSVTASDIDGKTLRPDLWGWASGNDGSTEAKAFTITTTAGLDQLATLVNSGNGFQNKFFKLNADITYSHKADNEEGADTENNFTTIGVYIQERFKCFCGILDGQGHTISGIRIYKGGDSSSDDNQGLFRWIYRSEATIKNVILADTRITGRSHVGGIVGNIFAGTVENCRVGSDVTIHAATNYADCHGGVVGVCNQNGTIRGCVSSAILTVADGLTDISCFGGIVGAFDGNMSDCLALDATMPAVTKSGAIAGSINARISTQTNCYHRDCTVGGNGAPSNTYNVSAYTVNAGTYVTMAPAGSADTIYEFNGIQRYGDALYYGGVIYAPEDADVSLTLGYNGSVPTDLSIGYVPSVGALSGSANPYTLTMPAGDVTINAFFGVEVPYIDEKGVEHIATAIPLDNTMMTLAAGTYVVNSDVTYYSTVTTTGDVTLILADGARLYAKSGINSDGYDLTIYGQAAGSGELSLDNSIYCNNICINGGIINNYNGPFGIHAYGNVTINDGTINIENGNDYGIFANNGNVTINGGTLSFNSYYGIVTSNVILASSTSLKTLNITRGFYVYTISLDRTFTVGKPATLMLPFYMDVNYISGGTFYTFGGVEKENDRWVATMNAVTDYIEPNTPYLVMPTETSLTFNHGTHLCTEGGGGGQTADEGSHWTFKGTYDYIKWTTDTSDPDYTAERAAEIGRVYGFAGVQKDGIEVDDFVKAASGARIRPMSAYLMWSDTPNAQNAPMRGSSRTGSAQELPQSITVRLLDASGTVTNVGEIDTVTGEISFEGWYTLQGVKLDSEPTEPGIYINNGKKVSIK